MSPKEFQRATVRRVVERLKDPAGSRRFLVADEVGLGKTLVAQGVIKSWCASGKHQNVFYICSSLSIAHQNRRSLLEILTPSQQKAAEVEVDRLTLLPTIAPDPKATPFTLFTLTPGTMPLKNRRGRVDERALLAELIYLMIPELRRFATVDRRLCHGVNSNTWTKHKSEAYRSLSAVDSDGLQARLRRQLCRLLTCDATSLGEALRAGFADDAIAKTTIRTLRIALSHAAVENLDADLIIFDEFQNFFDELLGTDDEDADQDARELMKRLLEGPSGRSGPALLLLSATPYRLYTSWEDGGQAHYRQFFKLLTFLYGREAGTHVPALKVDFGEYRRILSTHASGSEDVFGVRDRIQGRLSLVMARNERASLLGKNLQTDRPRLQEVAIEPLDVRLFRHLAESLRPEHRGMTTSLWSSIPFPMQMLDGSYVVREKAQALPLKGPAGAAEIRSKQVRRYARFEKAHPRLRALFEHTTPDLLALPWLPPSRPWWALGGDFKRVWESGNRSKVLIFSGYRAVPRAIAAIGSYEAELHAFEPRRAGGQRFDYRARGRSVEEGDDSPASGRQRQPAPTFVFPRKTKHDAALRQVPMFFPAPALAALGDPLSLRGIGGSGFSERDAVRQVAERIESVLGVRASAGPERPAWQWLVTLERRVGRFDEMAAGWRRAVEGRKGDGAQHACEEVLKTASFDDRVRPTRGEITQLAYLALLAPANVLLRAVDRVFGATPEPATRLSKVTDAAVTAMRGYLDTPEFHVLFRGRGKLQHPAAVRQAIWDGNLESTLDEYLSMLRGFGSPGSSARREEAAFDALSTALGIRASSVDVRHAGGSLDDAFKMRCHAALPFGLSPNEVASDKGKQLRSDFLRVSFNSPFRPYVLATTSIGQEGLDFHVYCNHVVHWDLPSNPVELEQRDGRVNRYAGLAVRRILANRITALRPNESPWTALGQALQESAGGLSPWWIVEGAEILRTVFIPHFSKQRERLEHLLSELALYRLTLGQADQEQLIRTLRHRLAAGGQEAEELLRWFFEARIELSPYRLERKQVGTQS